MTRKEREDTKEKLVKVVAEWRRWRKLWWRHEEEKREWYERLTPIYRTKRRRLLEAGKNPSFQNVSKLARAEKRCQDHQLAKPKLPALLNGVEPLARLEREVLHAAWEFVGGDW